MADVADITDYVANGSFASLRENVTYKSEKDYAILVRLADYSNGFDDSKYVYIDKHSYDFLAKSSLQGGEIIMSNVGSVGKLFICPDLGMPMSLAPNTIVIKTEYNRFYYYLLSSTHYQNQIQSITSKTALPKFNKTSFKKIEVSIPPLEKQERIVAELDLLTGIIDKQKQQLKELDTLAQSIFYDMFGNPEENTKCWRTEKLQTICTSLFAGGDVPKDNYSETKSETYNVPILSNGVGDKAVYGYTNKARVFDECITISGRGTIGYCEVRSEPFFPVVRLIVAVPNKDVLLPIVLKYIVDSLHLHGVGVAIPQLTIPMVKNVSIILPSMEMQCLFAKIIQSIESQKDSINRSIAESQKIFDYTMDKYFG